MTTTPAQRAAVAAEALRALIHATHAPGDVDGFQEPADVAATLTELTILVERLPQALEQATRWLDQATRRGAVQHDAVSDPEMSGYEARVTVLEIQEAVGSASARLRQAAERLQAATDLASHLSGV